MNWGPDNPAKIAKAAKVFRTTYGRGAALGLHRWADLGEVHGCTHYGFGMPFRAIAEEIERLDALNPDYRMGMPNHEAGPEDRKWARGKIGPEEAKGLLTYIFHEPKMNRCVVVGMTEAQRDAILAAHDAKTEAA